MASAPDSGSDELFDEFLANRGHETETVTWERDHNKKRCPECSGLHDLSASRCSVCDWTPD